MIVVEAFTPFSAWEAVFLGHGHRVVGASLVGALVYTFNDRSHDILLGLAPRPGHRF